MLLRSALPAFVLVFYGSLLLLRELGLHPLYDTLLYGLGIIPSDWLFVDTHAVLSAAQCHRAGVDVIVSNPCDVLGRRLSYSPFWLTLIPPFVTTDDTFVVGVVFNLSFVAALYVVLRPASCRELIVLAAACMSTDVTFAVERGNVDLVLFALATLALVLLGRGATMRLVAYATFFFGGLLKYYPLVLLTMSLRETPARFAKVASAASVALLAFLVIYRTELSAVPGHFISRTYFSDMFGARNLPLGLIELHVRATGGVRIAVAVMIFLVLLAASLTIARVIARRVTAQGIAIDWDGHGARCLVVGSLLIVGCFFAVQSIGYRGIHLLFVLSGLMALLRSVHDDGLKRLLLVTIGAVVLLMWQEGIRHGFELLLHLVGWRDKVPGVPSQIFWMLRELTWWGLISVLTAVIALFAIESQCGRAVARRWTPPASSSS